MTARNQRIDGSQIRINDVMGNDNGHDVVKNRKQLNGDNSLILKAVQLGFMRYCQGVVFFELPGRMEKLSKP
ncbi:hypothetical protein BPIT_18600 [Candidatus Brocadia pituitae]|nr:hypothetical protein BPIT_18600 [Candidatus Brocadia pituitae]